MKEILLYTSNTWTYCHQVMDYFKEKNVEFEERNVSTDTKARKELMSKGIMGVPAIFIGEDLVQGFDKKKIDELLGL